MAHLLRVLDPVHGDEHLEWDPEDEKSVKAAEKRFNTLVKGKGAGRGAHHHRAYRVDRRRGEPITEFDPQVGEILIAPPMAGG